MPTKYRPFSPATYAILFFDRTGQRTRGTGLASHYTDLEARRRLAQSGMRLIPEARYATLHPYLDAEHYQEEAIETVPRESVEPGSEVPKEQQP